jgi:hypothetical protein
VILCRETDLVDLISMPFFEALEENTIPALYDQTKYMFGVLTPQSFAKGAVAMVLEQVYQAS